jgi:hypothetical protein
MPTADGPLRIRLAVFPDSPLYAALVAVSPKGRGPRLLTLATQGLRTASAQPSTDAAACRLLAAAVDGLRQAVERLAAVGATPLAVAGGGDADAPPPTDLPRDASGAPTSREEAPERLWLAEARAMGQAWMVLVAQGEPPAEDGQEDPHA